MPFLSVSLSKVFSCIKIELVLCVSSPVRVLFLQSIVSITSVTILSSSILFGTNFDWFSLHLAHLSSTNLVSVYDSPCPILCKSVITSIEPVFLYVFNDNNTCERDGFVTNFGNFSSLNFGQFYSPIFTQSRIKTNN